MKRRMKKSTSQLLFITEPIEMWIITTQSTIIRRPTLVKPVESNGDVFHQILSFFSLISSVYTIRSTRPVHRLSQTFRKTVKTNKVSPLDPFIVRERVNQPRWSISFFPSLQNWLLFTRREKMALPDRQMMTKCCENVLPFTFWSEQGKTSNWFDRPEREDK